MERETYREPDREIGNLWRSEPLEVLEMVGRSPIGGIRLSTAATSTTISLEKLIYISIEHFISK